jgi:hypothetical protein
MVENLSGGTTNLLRMARSGCQSAVAFVALSLGDQNFATATYPADLGEGPPTAAAVDDLVRQLWLEPGLAQGKALVRTVQLGGHHPGHPQARLAVAALPLGAANGREPTGILGVADPEAKSFGLPELELLSRIAQRLTSYVRARQAVRTQLAAAEAGHEAPSRPAPWGEEALGVAPDTGAAAAEPVSAVGTATGPPVTPPAVPGAPRVPPQAAPSVLPGASWVTPPAVPGPSPVGVPAAEGPPSEATVSEARASEATARALDPLAMLLGGGDSVPGLVPLGALLGRAGRLLGAGSTAHGSLAVIVVTVEGVPQQDTGVVANLVRSLRTDLRFDDPVASIGGLSLVAVVPLAPGGASADQVEARLVERAREAVASHAGAVVRAAHVVAPLSAGRDADELLRAAVVKLRAA